MRKIRIVTFSLFVFVFITSCTKEGPQGPQGTAGPQGSPGGSGATGPAGTANVIYSSWFAASTLTWADSAHADFGTISRGNRAAPGVTTAVMNNGLVLSYYKDANAGTTTLPYIFGTTANLRQYNSILKSGTITYFAANLTSGTATGVIPAGEFRYVIIPGSIAGARTMSTANRFTLQQLQAMTYQQVADLFNIPASGSNQ